MNRGNSPLDLDTILTEMDGPHQRTRLFIAGCARSGTTMLLLMMKCFDDTHVELGEHPVSYFYRLNRDQSVHVLKRTYRCWKTLQNVPRSVKIVYMVRHPFDVLTSHHPNFKKKFYTSLERWTNEFDAFEKLQALRPLQEDLFVVRYEDLIKEPLEIQRHMEDIWNLRSRTTFDRFPEVVEVDKIKEGNKRQVNALGGLRRPDSASMERWRRNIEDKDYLQALITRSPEKLVRFLDRFGYARGQFNYQRGR